MTAIEIPRDESPARHAARQAHKRGVIVCAGPLGEPYDPDFTDHRYWVQWARTTNAVETDALELTEWAKGLDNEPDDHGYYIVMVTNLAENLDQTHFLRPGQWVDVYETSDKSASADKRYYIVHPP